MKLGKDGRYHGSFRFDGKTYSVAGKSESDVHRKIGRKRAELEAGKVKPKKITVRQYAREWVKTYHGTGSANDRDYASIVENHIIPALGDLYMKDVTEGRLQLYMNEQDVSASRLHKIKITLCQMFHKARKNHVINDDPAEDLKAPPIKGGSRRSITDLERGLLLAVLPNHRGNIYCKLMLYCGLRPGEVNALQWKHVDLESGIIHVRQALKHNSTVIGPPKSAAGIRDIPIPEILLSELSGGPDDGFVASWDGGLITRAAQSRMWHSVKREMDILGGAEVYRNRIVRSVLADDLDLYCLRHTYCTDLQKAGVPINVARELMGHSSIEVTAQIYTHTSTAETKKAAEKLQEQVSRPSSVVYVKFGT